MYNLTVAGDYMAYSEDKAYSGVRVSGDGSVFVQSYNSSPSSIQAMGGMMCNNWFRSVGNTGWYSETHGGGWFMQDSTWIRSYGSKNVYIDKVCRADAGFQVGNSGGYFNVSSVGTVTSGAIKSSGESTFANGTYYDPWTNTACAIKASGHIATTGYLKANGGLLHLGLGGTTNASYVTFYDSTGTRKGYVGKGSPSSDDLYLSADTSKYVLTVGHLCPSGNRMYWVGTNSPARQWKGLCAEGGTVGASDVRSKENIERLDGTIVTYDEVSEELNEYQLSTFKASTRAIGSDYYEFIKDRFKPSYYNYKLSENQHEISGEYTISPEDEYNMLKNVGFLAQDYDLETDKVAQEFIFKNEDGTLSYNHMSYVTVGIIALQEATRKIEALENENAQLKKDLKEIKEHLGLI